MFEVFQDCQNFWWFLWVPQQLCYCANAGFSASLQCLEFANSTAPPPPSPSPIKAGISSSPWCSLLDVREFSALSSSHYFSGCWMPSDRCLYVVQLSRIAFYWECCSVQRLLHPTWKHKAVVLHFWIYNFYPLLSKQKNKKSFSGPWHTTHLVGRNKDLLKINY